MRNNKPLQRQLLNIAAAFSLLLCMGVISLWVRSTEGGDKWYRDGPRAIAIVTWNDSILVESRVHTVAPYSGNRPSSSRAANETDDRSVASSGWKHTTSRLAGQWVTSTTWLGFGEMSVTSWVQNNLGGSPMYQIERGRLLVVPLWCPLFALMVLPTICACRWLARRRRSAPGLCISCGYDLRASPDRCPECGTMPEAEKGTDAEVPRKSTCT